jgi:hypothetical protein
MRHFAASAQSNHIALIYVRTYSTDLRLIYRDAWWACGIDFEGESRLYPATRGEFLAHGMSIGGGLAAFAPGELNIRAEAARLLKVRGRILECDKRYASGKRTAGANYSRGRINDQSETRNLRKFCQVPIDLFASYVTEGKNSGRCATACFRAFSSVNRGSPYRLLRKFLMPET